MLKCAGSCADGRPSCIAVAEGNIVTNMGQAAAIVIN